MKFKYHSASVSQGWRSLSQSNAGTSEYMDTKRWLCRLVSVTLVFIMLVTMCIYVGILFTEYNEISYIVSSEQIPQDEVISCYYNTPDNTSDKLQLLPSQIHPHLCTHINVAFATVVDKKIYLDQHQYETLQEVVKLKKVNPQLKVLLSVGGAGADNGFSEMVVDHASRKVFIKSIKSILRNYTLDGIDLDWEFPALHSELQKSEVSVRERQHFSQLLREIRMEYYREKRDYLLTVAVAAPQTIVDVSYDVDQINLYADFANIMTYDFHYYSKYTPFTGLNSPLYAREGEDLFPATLNINYTVQMYLQKGLDKSKIVVGIPTYGHTFELVNVNNPNVGSPALGFGSLGGGGGFADYPVICEFVSSGGVTQRWEKQARVPYLYRGGQWVSFDSPRSVAAKAAYIKAGGLRGAMLYSLNADDYSGRCGAHGIGAGATFPLAQSVRRVLRPAA